MKIRVLSDLHLELTNYLPSSLPAVGEDLVVLAGDIGSGARGIKWAQAAIPDRPVAYVLGNHEFYDEEWTSFVDEVHYAAQSSNVHVLENERLDLPGVRVLGCSLWTDFRAMGTLVRDKSMQLADEEMSDFFAIHNKARTRRLRPEDTAVRCLHSRRWLDQEISASERSLLVVTHHAPTMATLNPQYASSLSNAAFHNSFDELVRPPVKAWIHGHTHHSCQAVINGIPVLSNQRGYPSDTCIFAWDFCIDIT